MCARIIRSMGLLGICVALLALVLHASRDDVLPGAVEAAALASESTPALPSRSASELAALGPSAGFRTSTEYFRHMVTSGRMQVPFSFFAAPGITPYDGDDPDGFTAEHNAWCITAGITEKSPSETPVLFTRNLDIRTLADPTRGAVKDVPPYGRECVIMIFHGGAARKLPAAEAEAYVESLSLSNVVLRP